MPGRSALVRLAGLAGIGGRRGCAVIGAHLGTVLQGFRETMRVANLLYYRVMIFGKHPNWRRRLGRAGGDNRQCRTCPNRAADRGSAAALG
jgi:hypothetical protein